MAITSGTAINLPVNLEVMQSSLNDLQKVLNKLEPDSAPFKSLSRIILEMTRGMEKFQIQTSKGFTSQRQFDQAQKTVEKLEESLTRAQLAISRIKFLLSSVLSGIPIILKTDVVGSALSPKRKFMSLTILTFGI